MTRRFVVVLPLVALGAVSSLVGCGDDASGTERDPTILICTETRCDPGEQGVGGANIGVTLEGSTFPEVEGLLPSVGCDATFEVKSNGSSEMPVFWCNATPVDTSNGAGPIAFPLAADTNTQWVLSGDGWSCQLSGRTATCSQRM